MRRIIYLCIVLLSLACGAFGLGQDQLYTGTALTVPPGQVQFQLFGSTSFGKSSKVAGTSFTFGATRNFDAKIAYGYLWNYRGPNAELGPNVGVKWRFMGDGKLKPSMSLSLAYASNESGLGDRRSDVGSLLIVQSPVGPLVFLGNFGHVWTGDNAPDVRYLALALAKIISPKVLTAAQYIQLDPIGTGKSREAYVAAVVLKPTPKTGYSLQLGYLPEQASHWNATLGGSWYF